MKIYTKNGDKGVTSLFGGEKVLKNHARIEAYGTVDELNSVLGVIHSFEPIEYIKEKLTAIQKELFVIGADLATPNSKKSHVVRINEVSIANMESYIDEMDAELPALTTFILPSGTQAATQLHVARTVCRRAERAVLSAMHSEEINPLVLQYLNRLSDLFFVMARFENFKKNQEETRWLPD
ncbi:cob(I)yrinic acid a,c-diamide adenosyltransferase [bacterium]|nr:MAG: cob(I)yrinic acid a,c-diamide adenosyltransferase [bacterium]